MFYSLPQLISFPFLYLPFFVSFLFRAEWRRKRFSERRDIKTRVPGGAYCSRLTSVCVLLGSCYFQMNRWVQVVNAWRV